MVNPDNPRELLQFCHRRYPTTAKPIWWTFRVFQLIRHWNNESLDFSTIWQFVFVRTCAFIDYVEYFFSTGLEVVRYWAMVTIVKKDCSTTEKMARPQCHIFMCTGKNMFLASLISLCKLICSTTFLKRSHRKKEGKKNMLFHFFVLVWLVAILVNQEIEYFIW